MAIEESYHAHQIKNLNYEPANTRYNRAHPIEVDVIPVIRKAVEEYSISLVLHQKSSPILNTNSLTQADTRLVYAFKVLKIVFYITLAIPFYFLYQERSLQYFIQLLLLIMMARYLKNLNITSEVGARQLNAIYWPSLSISNGIFINQTKIKYDTLRWPTLETRLQQRYEKRKTNHSSYIDGDSQV
jgi:hypothetical protein